MVVSLMFVGTRLRMPMPAADSTRSHLPSLRGLLARVQVLRPGSTLPRLLLYEFGRWVLGLAAVLIYRLRTFGWRHVPASGPLLIVANHQSFLDPPLVGLAIHNRQLDYVARIGLFQNRALAALIRVLNAIPIREDASDTAAIRAVLARLQAGAAVLMFPEGTRTPDGTMQPFKRGVALLVRRAGCPVLPVAIEGAYDTWPRTRRRPRLLGCRLAVAVGRPIPAHELLAEGETAAVARLAREIDQMRRELRRHLRRATRGRFPSPGPGDRVDGTSRA